MTRAPVRALGLAAIVVTALLASGCSSLPSLRDGDEGMRSSTVPGAQTVPLVALYALEVDAPGALKPLLETHLDLARFREAPTGDAFTGTELDRLIAAAPSQARALLETEGYFNAEVTVRRTPGEPLVRVVVTPGPRVVVANVDIDTAAPIAPRSVGRDTSGLDRLETLRRSFPLPPGLPFRQDAWSAAKTATVNQLRVDGHPAASIADSRARIDAIDNRADLSLTVDPGPLYRFGAVAVEGIERYDEASVRRLLNFSPGDIYSEQVLLELQERLLKAGLFEGASVEIDASAGTPAATTVTVSVKELTQKQATFGIGYSANTGPRVSVDYIDRKLFGQRLISRSRLEDGTDLKSLSSDLTTWPLEGGWRHFVAASLERLRAVDEVRRAASLRVGRAREASRIDRLYSLEAIRAELETGPYAAEASAGLFNASWLRRDLDNVLTPLEGTTILAQGGAGYGSGRRDVAGLDVERRRGPFLRAHGRLQWFRPVGNWFASARLELGEVLVRSAIAVPDTLLFRAGGDDSVRGYEYRSLGPSINGEVASGRVLATGSVELARPFTSRLPSLLGAVFVDAGNAADRWRELRPAFGYGVGLRYRSPVGPLKLDLAYGHEVERFRLHFSVGVVF